MLWLARMYSAPHFDTYQVGWAFPPSTIYQGDDIADLCYIDTINGHFDLVLNRNGQAGDHHENTAAFIHVEDLQYASSTSCVNLFPYPDRLFARSSATLYSAPYSDTYVVGVATDSDVFSDICWVTGGDGRKWEMVLDRSGLAGNHYADTAAFIPQDYLAGRGGLTPPC